MRVLIRIFCERGALKGVFIWPAVLFSGILYIFFKNFVKLSYTVY